MNRRDFLKLMGITAAGVAAPKLIFDLGANSYKRSQDVNLYIPDNQPLNSFAYVKYNRLYVSANAPQYFWFTVPPTGQVGGIYRA